MNFERLVRVRALCRKIGITRIVGWRSYARYARRRKEFDRTKCTEVTLYIGGKAAALLVNDAYEYARALSWKDDRVLLSAIVSRISVGETCWDVGASIGVYTMVMATAVGSSGRVLSFEPEPRSRRRLRENVRHNELGNVTVLEQALGREQGTLQLGVSEHACSGTHTLTTGRKRHPNTIAVEIASGDDLIAGQDVPFPNVIKIDVEGAEEDVLRGLGQTMRNPRCHTVLCEVHFALLQERKDATAPGRIVDALRRCGFGRLTWLDRSHLLATKESYLLPGEQHDTEGVVKP